MGLLSRTGTTNKTWIQIQVIFMIALFSAWASSSPLVPRAASIDCFCWSSYATLTSGCYKLQYVTRSTLATTSSCDTTIDRSTLLTLLYIQLCNYIQQENHAHCNCHEDEYCHNSNNEAVLIYTIIPLHNVRGSNDPHANILRVVRIHQSGWRAFPSTSIGSALRAFQWKILDIHDHLVCFKETKDICKTSQMLKSFW